MKNRICIALFACILALLSAAGVQAAEYEGQSLLSIGSGFVVVPADIAVVSVAVETTAKDSEVAHKANQQVIDRIIASLEAEQLPGLQCIVRQVLFWENSDPISQTKTYKASSGLDIQVSDLNAVGHVASVAMQNGATALQNIRFDASNLEAAAKDALQLAVKDAITKAEAIAAAAGLRVAMVREVRDTNTIRVHNPSLPTATGRADAAAGTSTSLPPLAGPVYRGQVLVSAEVTVVFDVALDRSGAAAGK